MIQEKILTKNSIELYLHISTVDDNPNILLSDNMILIASNKELTSDLLDSTFSHTVTGLENGQQYFFVATAIFDPGQVESGYSNEASATPVPYQAPVPENLMAEPGDSEIHLSWDLLELKELHIFVLF